MKITVKDIPITSPDIDYYSRPEVSNSDLGVLDQELKGVKRMDPTAAYRFGNLFDCMVTEPWKVNYLLETCNKQPCIPEEFKLANEMREAFFLDKTARMIAKNSSPQSIFIKKVIFDLGNDISFSLYMRCKFDFWMDAFGFGADLKSTTATTLDQFKAAINFFNYDRQRAVYMTLAGSSQDMLIGVSKKNKKVFKVAIKEGDELFLSGMKKFEYLAFKYWQLFGHLI